MEELIGESWYAQLSPFLHTKAQAQRGRIIGDIRKKEIVYPPKEHTFRAFKLTPYEDVKVVIIGQDPYHDGSANGLCFSTNGKITPSLRLILEGMDADVGIGDYLEFEHDWRYLSKQGVLLMNTALTVSKGKPNSHVEHWYHFTIEVLRALAKHPKHIVFLLWGRAAADLYLKYGQGPKHMNIQCEHPAYAARQGRKWLHTNCFSRANLYLEMHERGRIIW